MGRKSQRSSFISFSVVEGLIAAAGAVTIVGAVRVIASVPVMLQTLGVLAERCMKSPSWMTVLE
jgi:hypothetical protein